MTEPVAQFDPQASTIQEIVDRQAAEIQRLRELAVAWQTGEPAEHCGYFLVTVAPALDHDHRVVKIAWFNRPNKRDTTRTGGQWWDMQSPIDRPAQPATNVVAWARLPEPAE